MSFYFPSVRRTGFPARVTANSTCATGGTPTFSPLKGFVINPPNLCSSSILNLLASYPEGTPTSPQPKLVVISTHGLTKTSHSSLPLLLKPLYSYALNGPHADKLVMERELPHLWIISTLTLTDHWCVSGAIFHAANWTWSEDEPKHTVEFLGADWQNQMKDPGYLKNVVVVRPSLFVDGDGKPAKGKYRTAIEKLPSAYTIARKEVAHFAVEGAVKNWEKWGGNVVNISE
jgi:hypothetical protein